MYSPAIITDASRVRSVGASCTKLRSLSTLSAENRRQIARDHVNAVAVVCVTYKLDLTEIYVPCANLREVIRCGAYFHFQSGTIW